MADTDWLQVMNDALMKIGSEPITAVTDTSKRALLVVGRYEPVRDIVLSKHPWKSASTRCVIEDDGDPPEFGYAFSLDLPSDFLRVVSLDEDTQADYKVEGKNLLYDAREADLVYVYKVKKPACLHPLTVEAIVMYLAWDICYPLTQNAALKAHMFDMWKEAFANAKVVDAQQNPSPQLKAGAWLRSRFSTGRPDRSNR